MPYTQKGKKDKRNKKKTKKLKKQNGGDAGLKVTGSVITCPIGEELENCSSASLCITLSCLLLVYQYYR